MTLQTKKSYLEIMHSKDIHWVCFIPLLFSFFYFIPMVQNSYTWLEYVTQLVGYGVFVSLYLMCRRYPERGLIYIAQIAILTFAISFINGASYSLVWYGAYYAGYIYTWKKASLVTFGLTMVLLATSLVTEIPFRIFLPYGVLPCISLAAYGMFDRKIRMEEIYRKKKNEQVEQLATIAERERLARDMHDVLGHNLTALGLKAQVAVKLGRSGDMTAALAEIEEVSRLASGALGDVRQAISEYKMRGFDDQLESLKRQLYSAGFDVTTDIADLTLDARREADLILVLTEAVTNIIRHSNGALATISLQKLKQKLQLTIADDGTRQGYTSGNGIQGMRERIQALGGEMTVKQQQGFIVQVVV